MKKMKTLYLNDRSTEINFSKSFPKFSKYFSIQNSRGSPNTFTNIGIFVIGLALGLKESC